MICQLSFVICLCYFTIFEEVFVERGINTFSLVFSTFSSNEIKTVSLLSDVFGKRFFGLKVLKFVMHNFDCRFSYFSLKHLYFR